MNDIGFKKGLICAVVVLAICVVAASIGFMIYYEKQQCEVCKNTAVINWSSAHGGSTFVEIQLKEQCPMCYKKEIEIEKKCKACDDAHGFSTNPYYCDIDRQIICPMCYNQQEQLK